MNIPKNLAKSIENPYLKGLPQYLKDPAIYPKIQRALLETLACPTSHSDPLEMFNCKRCTENMLARRELLKKLGFKSPAQYMEWRKVHEKIQSMKPEYVLPKYNQIKDE